MRKTNIRLLSNEEALKSQKMWYKELLNWIKSEKLSVLTKIDELDGGKIVIIPLKHSELRGSLYDIEERTRRLDEIGGLGVGGQQLRYAPPIIILAKTRNEKKYMKMVKEISRRYNEAMRCFVEGRFLACALLLASLLEGTLKLELERKGVKIKRLTLGDAINYSVCKGVFPNDGTDKIIRKAKKVNRIRNNLIHFNIEREDPEEISIMEPMERLPERIRKCVVTEDGKRTFLTPEQESKVSVIKKYKKAAIDIREAVDNIFKFLYDPNLARAPSNS